MNKVHSWARGHIKRFIKMRVIRKQRIATSFSQLLQVIVVSKIGQLHIPPFGSSSIGKHVRIDPVVGL